MGNITFKNKTNAKLYVAIAADKNRLQLKKLESGGEGSATAGKANFKFEFDNVKHDDPIQLATIPPDPKPQHFKPTGKVGFVTLGYTLPGEDEKVIHIVYLNREYKAGGHDTVHQNELISMGEVQAPWMTGAPGVLRSLTATPTAAAAEDTSAAAAGNHKTAGNSG